MKKRIFSILLVAVMLLAAIPAFSVSANPELDTLLDYNTYRSIVTTETIIVDGQLDEVYKNTEKITPSHWVVGSSDFVSFEAYTAVTLQGVYIWAEIKDGVLDKSKDIPADLDDKFQIYIKMDDGVNLSWGWYDTDYNGKMLKHSVMDASDLEIPIASDSRYSDLPLGDPTYACVKLPDGSGWRSETFIPFAVDPVNVKFYKVAIGLQANHNSSGEANYSACCDKEAVKSAWYGYGSYTPLNLIRMDDVPTSGTLAKNAVYVEGSDIAIDGKKDEFYSEHAKVILNVNYTSEYAHENGKNVPPTMGTVYIAFDDDYIYVYYERYDTDLIHDTVNDTIDGFQTCYYFENGGDVKSGYFTALIDPDYDPNNTKTPSVIYSHVGGYRGWPGTIITKSTIVAANAALGNDTYGVEYKLPIPAAEKAKLAASDDATLNVKMVFATYDFCSDENGDGKAEFLGYAGCNPNAAYTYSDYNAYQDKMTLLALSRSFTEETPGSIYGANLSLGSDITVNYYATVGSADIAKTYMRFTRGENEYIAYPKREGTGAQYKFAFKGIAPQTLGDNIKAELVIDGKVVDTYDGYSARENLVNLLANPAYANDVKLSNLIKSLMNYGAAAQDYAEYNRNQLVNKDYEVVLLSPTESDSVRSIGSKISDATKMTALGVYFDSVNKIYVKFTAPSLEGVNVTFNGEPASIQKMGDQYIAYSDGVPVSQFHLTYEIVLTSSEGSQRATYSVNSYAYAKLNSADKDMVELAKATYTYGDCAKKYAGLGDTAYTVMTYNDADNNDPYHDNYENVIQIVKDTAPDLVGMQEVQGQQKKKTGNFLFGYNYVDDTNKVNHAAKYEELFGAIGYGWIWYERGYAEGGQFAEQERLKPSGVGIAYNKAKFDLIETKHFWLSDTPDKVSKYEESDYTHDFVAALLEDKVTHERFVFVCVHLNYLDDANPKQAEVLLNLLETPNEYMDYSGYRKIYVGDYNCYPGVQGYAAMNEAGYTESADMATNTYKPSTSSNGSLAIDFIFAKTEFFRGISYKVLSDHPLAFKTSDHYPVLAKFVTAKSYDDVPLADISYRPPVYEDFDGGFDSADDREGF